MTVCFYDGEFPKLRHRPDATRPYSAVALVVRDDGKGQVKARPVNAGYIESMPTAPFAFVTFPPSP